ncbi:MAG: pilus assembly protein TadG-related protein [Pseudomonas sp.]
MSPQMDFCADRGRQRGAIGLMAALTLGLALLFFLLVIDSGRLYLEKRNLQRVADTAALEAATRAGQCTPTNTASGYAITAATRNGFTVTDNTRTLTTDCGTLATGADKIRAFSVNAAQNQAIRVVVTHSVAQSIAGGVAGWTPLGSMITLSATAVATLGSPPLASLTIRSTLLNVDASKSAALNALFGGLLGGNLNLSLASWQGLVGANINLLSYLNQLAIDTHVAAGDYTTLLSNNISLTQLLSTAVTVLPQNDPAVQAAISGLGAIQAIAGNTTVQLKNLLNLQTGTPTAALNLNMNLFQLVQGEIQLANSQSAVFATIPANVLGLAGVTVRVKVIEPPQLSAAGNPALAKANPTGPNQIYVRTAQIRTLISVDLSLINSVLSTVNALLSPVMAVIGPLGADLKIAPQGLNLDVDLEAASASSHVTDYTCASNGTKSLTASTTTAAVVLKVGKIVPTNWNSSSAPLVVNELPIIDIGTTNCPFLQPCQPRVTYGGGGMGLLIGGTGPSDGAIASTTQTYAFTNPAVIGQPPDPFYTFGSTNIIGSLQGTLNGIQLIYHPPVSTGLLSLVLGLVTGVLSQVLGLLSTAVGSILGPILDPLINLVLQSLGINLASVDVGANLSCSAGQAALVI